MIQSQVCGESRKKHHSHGRWERFIDWATRGLHSIQDIAVKKRRNYILDQVCVTCFSPNQFVTNSSRFDVFFSRSY